VFLDALSYVKEAAALYSDPVSERMRTLSLRQANVHQRNYQLLS
jgi:hypothetical protein